MTEMARNKFIVEKSEQKQLQKSGATVEKYWGQRKGAARKQTPSGLAKVLALEICHHRRSEIAAVDRMLDGE